MRACLSTLQSIQARTAGDALLTPLCRMHALMPETMALYLEPPQVLRSCRLFYRAITRFALDGRDLRQLADLLGAPEDDPEAIARGLALEDKDAVILAVLGLFRDAPASQPAFEGLVPEPAPGPVPFSAPLMTFDRKAPEPLVAVMKDADLAVDDVRKIAPSAADYIAATRAANAPQNNPTMDGLLAVLHGILRDLRLSPSEQADAALATWWTRRAFAALYGGDDALRGAHPTKSTPAFFDLLKRDILVDPAKAPDPMDARGVRFEELAGASGDRLQDLGGLYVAAVDALLRDDGKLQSAPPDALFKRRAALGALLGSGPAARNRAALDELLFDVDVLAAFDGAAQARAELDDTLLTRGLQPPSPAAGPYLALVQKASAEDFVAIVGSIDAHAERHGGQVAWLLGQLDAETVVRRGRGIPVAFAAWADRLYAALYGEGQGLPKQATLRRAFVDDVAAGDADVPLEYYRVVDGLDTAAADAELRDALLSSPPSKEKPETAAFAKWLASRTDRPAALALDMLRKAQVAHPRAARAAAKSADELLTAAKKVGLTVESSSALTKWFVAALYQNVYGTPGTLEEFRGMHATLASGREAPAEFQASPQVRRRKLEARPALAPISIAAPQQRKAGLEGARPTPGALVVPTRKRAGLSLFGSKKPRPVLESPVESPL